MIRKVSTLAVIWLLVSTAAAFDLDSLLVKSIGGPSALDSLKDLTSYRAEGSVNLNGQTGRFCEYFAPPDHSYLKLDFQGFSLIQAYDGHTAWQKNHNGQVSELKGFEKDELLKGMYFDSHSYLFHDRLKGSREYRGQVKIDEKNHHKVVFCPLNRDTVTTFFDAETGYLAITTSRLDELVTNTSHDGYRLVGGILWSFHSQMAADNAPLVMEFTYDRIVVNDSVDISIFSQPDACDKDYRFPDGAQSLVIPLDYNGGHIRVQVTINGRKKAWLILDSGASANVLDESLVAGLGLPVVGRLPAKGMSGYEEVRMVRSDSLSIGELTLLSQTVGVLDLTGISGLWSDGAPPGGILGYDFLSRFPLMIDFSNSTLTVYNPENFVPPDGGFQVPFHLTMHVPTVAGELIGIPGEFIVDLGNPFGLIIHRHFSDSHQLTEKLDDVRGSESSIGGIGGHVSGRTAFAATFQIGDVLIQSLRVILADSAPGLAGSEKLAGNIGNLVLENFGLLLDYNDSRLILYDADKLDR